MSVTVRSAVVGADGASDVVGPAVAGGGTVLVVDVDVVVDEGAIGGSLVVGVASARAAPGTATPSESSEHDTTRSDVTTMAADASLERVIGGRIGVPHRVRSTGPPGVKRDLTSTLPFARIEHMFRQASLFGSDDPCFDPSFSEASRSALSRSSWIEYVPGWLDGADSLFDDLMDRLDFQQRTGVPMYDRLVDEPRLTSWWNEAESSEAPLPVLTDARWALADRYDRHFDSIGFNLYRDQNDSVAWHADRHRHRVSDPVVAILSVGESRPFQMRRVSDPEHGEVGGASLTWGLGHGDLLVMGGACQHEWQHCVPKRRRHAGPRMSITFRHDAR